ncbi:MAG: hypothetical protein HPY66_1783 [Firmicutes bacterium]|nr:hypothetical protein [Bacillota bacterium]MDI6729761.1 hypothetical protein [Thermodesulfovibrionales bacterium]
MSEFEGKGVEKMEAILQNKFNIRDTKRFYSDINEKALNGIEVITYNAMGKTGEVSHLSKRIVDFLFDSLQFHISEEFDEELGVYTISVDDINIYGEGSTKAEAIEDLLTSIIEYTAIYVEQIDLFSKVENITKQGYMLKVIRCGSDREKLKKVLGL